MPRAADHPRLRGDHRRSERAPVGSRGGAAVRFLYVRSDVRNGDTPETRASSTRAVRFSLSQTTTAGPSRLAGSGTSLFRGSGHRRDRRLCRVRSRARRLVPSRDECRLRRHRLHDVEPMASARDVQSAIDGFDTQFDPHFREDTDLGLEGARTRRHSLRPRRARVYHPPQPRAIAREALAARVRGFSRRTRCCSRNIRTAIARCFSAKPTTRRPAGFCEHLLRGAEKYQSRASTSSI